MKALQFKKEDGKEITIFNFHALEKEDMTEEGLINVLLEPHYGLTFENVKEIMRVFDYKTSELGLQASLILNSVEENGEVHFYLDQKHEELIKSFTEENGVAFKDEEPQRFHLYIPEKLSNKTFQDIPVGNITLV